MHTSYSLTNLQFYSIIHMILLFVIIMVGLPIAQSEFYSLAQDYQVSSQPIPGELAHIRLLKTYQTIGWDQLYIYTNKLAAPLDQHRAAGFLEGYATYKQIHAAYLNFMKLDFNGSAKVPAKIKTFMDDQLQYMDHMIKINQGDQFWDYVGYYLEQIRFMHAGYQVRIKKEGRLDLSLEFQMVYYLPSIGDLEDLIYLQESASKDREPKLNCNAYVKLNGSQLYTTHATHNRYPFLLRTYKFWSFPRTGVPMQFTSFTSRPGDLISKDDFILPSSGLRVLQTSLGNYDKNNFKQMHPNTVPSWIRTVVANHLSKSTDEWINYFLKWRSGTHNNQWLIVDPSKIGQKKGVAVFFQEAFSLSATVDMTESLYENGYVASYNCPVNMDIYNKLGYTEASFPIYPNQQRAKIFKAYHPKMTDIEAMKYWLINNEEEHPYQGLAPRCDLLSISPAAFGLTDCKIASETTIKQNFFWAMSGPSTSNGRFPPFDWNKWTDPETPHFGLADVYDFGWVKIYIDLEAQERVNAKITSQI